MKAVIISGGTPPKEEILKEEILNANILIAADKGLESFLYYNIEPHYALGDFDSINVKIMNKVKKTKIVKYNPDKDNTDSEIAVLKAIELGAEEIVLLGVTGTRIDHMLANLGLLDMCINNNINAYIRDSNNKILLTNKSIKLYGNPGQFVSFQCFGQTVNNFSIKGAKYELNNYTLSFGDRRCVSNEFLNGSIEVTFKEGKVLIIYSND